MNQHDSTAPIGHPALGWALACSRRGAGHRRSGQRCQDACAVWSSSYAGSAGLVLTVADGHGDERHDRSHIGAALAARVAGEELAGVFAHLKLSDAPQTSWVPFCSEERSPFLRRVKKEYPTRVVRRWKAALAEYEAEAGQHEESAAPATAGETIRYGTTLLSALLLEEVLFTAQLGDGVVLWLPDSGPVEDLHPKSPSFGSSETHSLCSPQAASLMSVAVRQRRDGGVLLLATDGFENSFPSAAALHDYAASLCERIRAYRPDEVALALPDWLDTCSGNGSADDITLGVVRITPAPLSLLVSRQEAAARALHDLKARHAQELEQLRASQQAELAQLTSEEAALKQSRQEMLKRHKQDSERLQELARDQRQEAERRAKEQEKEVTDFQQTLRETVRLLGG